MNVIGMFSTKLQNLGMITQSRLVLLMITRSRLVLLMITRSRLVLLIVTRSRLVLLMVTRSKLVLLMVTRSSLVLLMVRHTRCDIAVTSGAFHCVFTADTTQLLYFGNVSRNFWGDHTVCLARKIRCFDALNVAPCVAALTCT